MHRAQAPLPHTPPSQAPLAKQGILWRYAGRHQEVVMTPTNTLRTLLALALALPLAAAAEQARTKLWVNVRAGPAGNYPMVTRLPPGAYVQVYGCTAGYRWCDVIADDGQRGWAPGGTLYYPYEDTLVPVIGYGLSFGIPITPFVMVDYWGAYYSERPWYGYRRYWGPGYGHGAGYARGYGPGYGPPYVPRPGYAPGPTYVPRQGQVYSPGHVPVPPRASGAGLPAAPNGPRLPRPPRPPGLPGLP
jgi:uncharacterized protein YraI